MRAYEHRRRFRLTCLHPCCRPIQIMWWFLGWLHLYNSSHSTEWMEVCTNRTIVTTQRNHHMIWIEWQQGCKHVSRIRLFEGVIPSLKIDWVSGSYLLVSEIIIWHRTCSWLCHNFWLLLCTDFGKLFKFSIFCICSKARSSTSEYGNIILV